MRRLIDRTVLRFLLVGIINTAVGTAVMFGLYHLAGASYWVSSAANYLAGGVVSYVLNKHFTFRNKNRSVAQVVLFAVNTAVCWLVAYGAAKPLMLRLLAESTVTIQENAAMLVGIVLYTGLNYLGQKLIVFKQ